jgi:cellulose synthase (UDP-forming)
MKKVIEPKTTSSAMRWLYHHLGIAEGAGFGALIWALFAVPSRYPISLQRAAREMLFSVLRPIGRLIVFSSVLLYKLSLLAFWPVRKAIHFLDWIAARINFELLEQKADRVLVPFLKIPGLNWILLLIAVLAGFTVISTPFSWLGQLFFLLLCWGVSMVVRRLPGRYPAMVLAAISLIALGRYFWWRVTTTLEFDTLVESLLGYGLLIAESYTWLVVVLGFIQTAWPLARKPIAMSQDITTWPTVDVFIPTYNEPLSVVRPTALAAMALDWPRDKLRIFILDDGRRTEFREFAEAQGLEYMVRSDNKHAKAGNLNNALRQTNGELVAIFDCDHIPTRSFLKSCVGWFQRDPKCAMLQTPHHFFSPDPFERNLGTFRRVPNEGSLFYGLIQDGNDLWDATFFCGSCAVLRREPLMEIGGIAVETVTEDAHTALKLHRKGYSTAYLNQTMAAGLATESLSAHVGQRIRWARGMAQIFRLDNPFFGKGLTFWQRLCYGNAMMHFFFGLPRLVFLTAPMAYLFFELHVITASAGILALYVLPYIIQSNVANAHVQGEHRHTFWAEVYETVLAFYLAWPTTVAIINPHAGKFNVTAKGGLVSKSYFDWVISAPYTVLVLLNFAAFFVGLLRFFIFNTNEQGTVFLNLIWTAYSIFILGAAIGVASESRQVRRTHRVDSELPANLYVAEGQGIACKCVDYSMSGLGLRIEPTITVQKDQLVKVGLWHDNVEHHFHAKVVVSQAGTLGLEFDALSRQDEIHLVQCTFARPDAWVNWNKTHDTDKPLQGLQEIAKLGLEGYKKLWESLTARTKERRKNRRSADGIKT